MGDSFDSWASIIRSCCLTSKMPLTPYEINRDTKMLEGRDIPFKQLGCSTLEDMLRKINGLTVFSQMGKTVVKITPTEETAHISRMVRLQKPANRKRRRRPPAYNKFPANYRSQPNHQNLPQYDNARNGMPNQRPAPNPMKQPVISPTQSAPFYRPPVTPPSAALPSQLPPPMAVSPHDPRLILKSYAEARKLPIPVYKYLPLKNNKFISSVVINYKKYVSYPKEAETKEEAEKLAAQAALDDLSDENWMPITTTSDQNLVVKRVEKKGHSHPNDSFESKLVELYQYNERLTQNYLKLRESLITLDNPANELSRLSLQTENDNRTISRSMRTEPDDLKLHEMPYFWLYVCAVHNTTAVWGVLTDDHRDDFTKLAKKMKVYYDSNTTKPPLVTPGKFYAVFDQEWHRVRCVKTGKKGQIATVFFIDRGEEDVFRVSELQVLPAEFCRLPAQAVRLSMAGLEIYENRSELQPFLKETLNGKGVYVKNLKYNQNSTLTNVISAQIYGGMNNRWCNVNELLRLEILSNDNQDQGLWIAVGSIFTFIRDSFDFFWPLLFLIILGYIIRQYFIQ